MVFKNRSMGMGERRKANYRIAAEAVVNERSERSGENGNAIITGVASLFTLLNFFAAKSAYVKPV